MICLKRTNLSNVIPFILFFFSIMFSFNSYAGNVYWAKPGTELNALRDYVIPYGANKAYFYIGKTKAIKKEIPYNGSSRKSTVYLPDGVICISMKAAENKERILKRNRILKLASPSTSGFYNRHYKLDGCLSQFTWRSHSLFNQWVILKVAHPKIKHIGIGIFEPDLVVEKQSKLSLIEPRAKFKGKRITYDITDKTYTSSSNKPRFDIAKTIKRLIENENGFRVKEPVITREEL